MDDASELDLVQLTADVVAAFVSNNRVSVSDIPALIASTHGALSGAAQAGQNVSQGEDEPEWMPAVTVRKSLGKPEHILSMVDGKPYKSLKRHLAGHGLTPDAYRARYKLPADYPMVAPAYSEARREMAKRIGLGRKPSALPSGEGRGEGTPAAAPAKRKPRGAKPKV